MKKFLAAALAGAMVVSMAATAFATVATVKTAHTYDSDDGYEPLVGKIAYGETIYYPLVDETGADMTSQEKGKGITARAKWDMGKELVESLQIVRKKDNSNYVYALAIKLKSSTSDKTVDLIGDVTLRKSGTVGFGKDGDGKVVNEIPVAVGVEVGYTVIDDSDTITDKTRVHNFVKDEELEIRFSKDENSYFTVNTMGQTKLLVKVDVKHNADIAAKYPAANLDFFNGNGASFNKTGTLSLAADEGSFIYAVDADGNLNLVKTTYDEYEGVYSFKTRTLGTYVIADRELKVTAPEVKPEEPTTKPNPGTGAVA